MLGRRVIALIVDWTACLLISYAFFDANSWVTLGLFAAVQVLTVGTIGASPGHRLLGLKVTRADGEWAGPARALIRTLLLCLVIPPVVMSQGRGLHDAAAGTRIGRWVALDTPARTR